MSIQIEGTKKTPAFKLEGNIMELSGRSIPEDAIEYYAEITNLLKKHLQEHGDKFIVNLRLDYINSASKKSLMQMIKYLEKVSQSGQQIVVNWYYDQTDEDMRESGEDLKAMLTLPINVLGN
ncbi:MAG: DUF1987 domain-containing protein [Bacteroidetes bacterium]|jgi:hypothetical protein|nr:DUF1987 domain-containing protein [Bacteroidota bacterium]